MTDDVEAVARAICRVQLNGGDPNQPAARWNGIQIELQDFPAWWDYRDEARHAIAALRALGWQKIEPGSVVVPVEPTKDMLVKGETAIEDNVETTRDSYATHVIVDSMILASVAYRAMIAAATKKPASGGDV